MKHATLIIIALSSLWLMAATAAPITLDKSHAVEAPSVKQVATQLVLRDLWVDHVFWVRSYVVANQANNSVAAKTAADQVVKNATSISQSIAPFYGDEAADQLLTLLAGHWGAVKDYSDATIRKSSAAQEKATKALVDNAVAIAKFLAGANPYLPQKTLESLLTTHGAHHLQQIQQIAGAKWDAEAATWAMMREHMYVIADALTGGLAKQFPDRF
jgi:hypothetical protein